MKLPAKPEPIEVDFPRSAMLVVDMQNAFVKKGGTLDLAGVDISDAARVVSVIRNLLHAARSAGISVVHLQVGYKADLSDAGGPRSPNYYKETAMHLMCARPDLKGKLLTEGSWDFAIVDELAPHPGDLVITKSRYSGFAGTTLDAQLRVRGIQYLFFAGIATNVCVESTLRDAYFLDYWPILLRDATMAAGGQSAYEASIFNVESFFGWTLTSAQLQSALAEQIARAAAGHAASTVAPLHS